MNLFKIMQSIRAMAQAGKIDFPGAIVYLQKLGVKMDGIVHQALKNVFKEGKARDIDFGNVVKDFPIDDAGIPFNPKTLKSTAEKRNIESLGKDATPLSKSIQEFFDAPKEKRGVENLFKNKSKTLADELSEAEGVETFETILPTKSLKEPKYGKLDYDRIAKMEGVDVEEIRGKTVKEIIEYLAMIQKKDGGRIGFEVGGLSDRAQAIYDSWIAAGHTEEDVLAYLTSQGLYGDQEATGIETITNTAPAITQGGDNDRAIRLPPRTKTLPSLTENQQANKEFWENQAWTSDMAKEKAFWENQPDNYSKPSTGILQKAKSKIWDPFLSMAGAAVDIPLGLLTAGARKIGDMLPYNERAVLENQMLESGFALDDIGRIVATGDYNTPEGIMAGYNAAQMTADTFDKRMHAIRNRKIAQTDASRKKLKDIQKAKELWQAAQDAADAQNVNKLGPNNPLIGKIDHTGGGGHGSITRAPGSVVAGAPTHRTRDDLMADGGLATMFTRRR
jgi:hypothetical protein